ncbi:MAG: hypothetical protein JSR36_04850 [Proteobacteria bacterium]|nr:hypothetical protein [Pseudomonadota bacterium]
MRVDPARNARARGAEAALHAQDSAVAIYAIASNEEALRVRAAAAMPPPGA